RSKSAWGMLAPEMSVPLAGWRTCTSSTTILRLGISPLPMRPQMVWRAAWASRPNGKSLCIGLREAEGTPRSFRRRYYQRARERRCELEGDECSQEDEEGGMVLTPRGQDRRVRRSVGRKSTRVAEVRGVAFPKLLDPFDDRPPTTVVTHVEGGW